MRQAAKEAIGADASQFVVVKQAKGTQRNRIMYRVKRNQDAGSQDIQQPEGSREGSGRLTARSCAGECPVESPSGRDPCSPRWCPRNGTWPDSRSPCGTRRTASSAIHPRSLYEKRRRSWLVEHKDARLGLTFEFLLAQRFNPTTMHPLG